MRLSRSRLRSNVPPSADVAAGNERGAAGPEKTADSSPLFRWRVGRIEAKGRERLVLHIVPREPKPFDMTIKWECNSGNSQAKIKVQQPKLSLALVGPHDILFGKAEVYKLEIANVGNADAENVTVSLSSGGKQPPAGHTIGTLAAGRKKAIDVELTGRQPGRLTIHGEVRSAGGQQAELNEEILVRQATLTEAKIAITVEDPSGPVPINGAAVYQVRLQNRGTAAAEGVEVVVYFDDDFEPVAAEGGKYRVGPGQVVFDIVPSLPAGQALNFTVRAKAAVPGNHAFRVEAHARPSADKVVREGTTRFYGVQTPPSAVAQPNGREQRR